MLIYLLQPIVYNNGHDVFCQCIDPHQGKHKLWYKKHVQKLKCIKQNPNHSHVVFVGS